MDLLFVMYMGGPDSLDDIEPFLYNLFSDRDIIDFKIGNLQKFIAKIIAKKRAKKVKPEYEKMGGKSPQITHLESLLKKVENIYSYKTNRELLTVYAMTYSPPFIESQVEIVQKKEFENLYVMTMYPQYSYATAGACFKRFFNQITQQPPKSNYYVIPHWYSNKKYNRCIIKRITDASEKLGVPISKCKILFSAHSLPEYTLINGDVYTYQLIKQIKYLTSQLGVKNYDLAFQSRTGPIKWLGPETSKVIDEYIANGVDNVIIVPISFVSDHIETLIELDEQYIKNAKSHGMNIVRIESLNDSDDFAESLIDIMEEQCRKS